MSEILDTMRAVGYIAQVQLSEADPDYPGLWLSWQQFTSGTPDENRRNARTLVESKLKDARFARGRVVRVDWTVEEVVNPGGADGQG